MGACPDPKRFTLERLERHTTGGRRRGAERHDKSRRIKADRRKRVKLRGCKRLGQRLTR